MMDNSTRSAGRIFSRASAPWCGWWRAVSRMVFRWVSLYRGQASTSLPEWAITPGSQSHEWRSRGHSTAVKVGESQSYDPLEGPGRPYPIHISLTAGCPEDKG